MSSLTDYPDIKSEIDSNNQEPKISTEQNIKDLILKVRPYVHKLWVFRWKIALFNLIILILTILYLLFLAKPYYISSITILPEYGSKSTTLGQLGDLAALAGVKVGDGAPTEIYENLIVSESVLEPVIYARYRTKEFLDSVNLIQYFEIDPDESLSIEQQKRKQFIKAIEHLTKLVISTSVERMSKILAINVKLPESKLSADVANMIAGSLDNYIRTKRKSYASEQRYYLEKRVIQVQDSLTLCENKLRNFRERNRVIIQSPMLILEQNRLMRNVEIMQTVYIEITKQLEIAKIDQIKNTPVVNVRELAKEPVIKAGPKRFIILIIVLFVSFLLSISYLIFKDDIKKYYRIIKEIN